MKEEHPPRESAERGGSTLRSELGRKAIHALGIVLPLGYVAFGEARGREMILALTAAVLAADAFRLASPLARHVYRTTFLGRLSRPWEEHRPTGASLFMIGQALAVLVFPASVAPAAMTFAILGDAAAAVAGRSIGGPRWWPDKTLAGSIAFALVSFLAGLAWGLLPWYVVLAGALVAAVVEGLSGRAADNIAVPLAGGFVMWALLGLGR